MGVFCVGLVGGIEVFSVSERWAWKIQRTKGNDAVQGLSKNNLHSQWKDYKRNKSDPIGSDSERGAAVAYQCHDLLPHPRTAKINRIFEITKKTARK